MKNNGFIADLLLNKAFYISLFFLLLQQIIVASSTYWIGLTAEKISLGQDYFIYLLLFITSLIIVYIPSVISSVYLEKSKFLNLKRYIEAFKLNFYAKTTHRTDKETENKVKPFLASESFLVIDEAHRFIYDWVSVILNVVFNVMVLAVILDGKIIYAYFAGLFFVTMFIWRYNPKIFHQAKTAQNARTALQGHLPQAWDHYLLGNHYNTAIYQQDLLEKQQTALSAAVKSKLLNNIISSFGMLLMMLPVIILLLFLFAANRTSPEILAILVATLPRQVMMLQYAYAIISYATTWSALKAKLQGLLLALALPDEDKTCDRIQWEKLSIKVSENLQGSEISLPQLVNATQLPISGRITLRGENGCGKSSYLCWLKTALGEHAYYLPAQHQLQFLMTHQKNLSTGQALKLNIDEVSTALGPHIRVVMLDEWDANLDGEAIKMLNQLIDKLAESRLVIEVRHRT